MSDILLRDFVRVDTGYLWESGSAENPSIEFLRWKEMRKYDILLAGIREILEGVDQLITDTCELLSLRCALKCYKVFGNGSGDRGHLEPFSHQLKGMYVIEYSDEQTQALDEHVDAIDANVEAEEFASESGRESIADTKEVTDERLIGHDERKDTKQSKIQFDGDNEESGEEYDIEDWEIDEIIAEANRKEALETGQLM